MAQELTFNISEDRRQLQGPVEAKNFNLKFGTDGSAITHGKPDQWVQGRIGDDQLKQVFVNITEGEGNTPKDVAGMFLAFVGIIHDKDGRPHRVVDYKHSTTIDVEHGRFRFDFPDQAFTVAGEYQQAFFMLIKEGPGGGCVATMEFDMQVMANFVFTDLVPEDYITPFNDTVDQLLAACKKFKEDTAADEAKFKQELDDAYAKFQKDTNTQFSNFKDATDDDLAKFKKANADDIAKFKQQYADAVQAKEDELQSKVDSYTDKLDTLLKDLNQQGIDTTTLLTTLQANIKSLEDKIKQDGLFTQTEAETFKQVIEQEIDKLRNNAVTVFDTETDLMQANLNSGLTVRTLGCTAAADGLGAIYKIVNEQPASGYSIKLANGKYAMLVSVDAFRKAHMIYQAGQVGELSDQRSLKTTNLVTNHGITASRNTKGSGQDATVVSIIANTQDPTSAVLGVDTPRIFAYKNLDSVALYIANGTDNPHITIQKGTYTTTKNEFILNEDIEGIEPGMYIALSSVETTHSKLNFSDIAYLAQILTVSGRTLTVDGYYSKDSEEPLDAGPSPSTYTAYINPITKRWGINPVVEIGADDRPSGSVIEGDVKNHNVSDDPDDFGVFDAVNAKEGKANYAFRAHTESFSDPFENGVDLTNAINLIKGYGTPKSFENIITANRGDKDIPYVMRYDGAVSYEALIPTTEQDANWTSFQVQDEGPSFMLKNIHDGQYLTLAIGTAGNFSLLADKENVQTIEYNDANTPYNGPKMTFMRSGSGYMLFRIFAYQNRAYIMSMTNGKFISAEGA